MKVEDEGAEGDWRRERKRDMKALAARMLGGAWPRNLRVIRQERWVLTHGRTPRAAYAPGGFLPFSFHSNIMSASSVAESRLPEARRWCSAGRKRRSGISKTTVRLIHTLVVELAEVLVQVRVTGRATPTRRPLHGGVGELLAPGTGGRSERQKLGNGS